MRENFEKYLKEQSDLAKKEQERRFRRKNKMDFLGVESAAFSQEDLNDLLEKGANEQSGTVEAQKEIYKLQKEKQKVMAWLTEKLADLDKETDEEKYVIETGAREIEEGGEENAETEEKIRFDFDIEDIENLEEERGIVGFNEDEQVFEYLDNENKVQKATLGEIVTDLEWDIGYDLTEIEEIPRAWKKRYLVERAKKTLLRLADEQIIISEKENETVGEMLQDTYESIRYGREIGADKRKGGFVSEIIVRSFLKQLAIDKGLPVKVEEADVYQDVVDKIDFILERQDDSLGVKVEEGEIKEENSSVAVQFTTAPDREKQKRQQIGRVERLKRKTGEEIPNIALVIFSKLQNKFLKAEWEKAGRPAGGPGKFMNGEVKKELFEKVLQNLFSEKEIEEEWRMVNGDEVRGEFEREFEKAGEEIYNEEIIAEDDTDDEVEDFKKVA